MAIQPVGFRPKQITPPKRLKGRQIAIPAGTEVVIGSVQMLNIGNPVMESLYYDGSAGGDGYQHFRVTLNGNPLPYAWADSYNPIGSVGNPAAVGQELPAGGLLEVRCKNEHPTDTFDAFSDGEVYTYETPIA